MTGTKMLLVAAFLVAGATSPDLVTSIADRLVSLAIMYAGTRFGFKAEIKALREDLAVMKTNCVKNHPNSNPRLPKVPS